MNQKYRIGIGYDVHRLLDGIPLILGGINIPYNQGLEGHSDADVVLHALCDALLGSLALKDIGHHFPNTDPKWHNKSSDYFLKSCYAMVKEKGYCLNNADMTIICETIYLQPYMDKIQYHISQLLMVSCDCISIKATTHEKLGSLGRGEGIATIAHVMVKRYD